MALREALRRAGADDPAGPALARGGAGTVLFGLLIASVIYAAACAAGDTKSLRKVYVALVTPSILIDFKIITLGSGDGLAMIGGVFQVLFLGFTCRGDPRLISCDGNA